MQEREISTIDDWHAHVYFDAEKKQAAWDLRQRILAHFPIEMGRFHERLVGPHPCWSYQIAFRPQLFGRLVPWLALNRGDLIVFIHPNTGEDLIDHRDHAIWLGARLDLNLEIFS